MVSLMIEHRDMVTLKGVEEVVWTNALVNDVDVRHPVDVVFEFVGDRNFCVEYSMLG